MKENHNSLFSMPLLVIVFSLLSAHIGRTAFSIKLAGSDPIAVHNMLVVGEKTIYLSHLPMFQEKNAAPMPHRYQAIFEVSFAKPGSTPGDQYSRDRESHNKISIYTINPEPFVLSKLAIPNPPAEVLHKFKASIFRGHLEKSGDKIISDADVQVNRVVYFHKFEPAEKKAPKLEYLLFGKGQELFLAHIIKAAPDFDQVLSVAMKGVSFTDEQLAKGIPVSFPAIANTAATRLKEKQDADGRFSLPGDSVPRKVQVSITREFYFEEGELRLPAVFETTKEEKKSGFM